MSAQERIARQDALFALLNRLPGEDFGGHPECAGTKDPEIFFPEGNVRTTRKAQAICGRCEIRSACLEFALRNGEHGIWGGTTEAERRQLGQGSGAGRQDRGVAA